MMNNLNLSEEDFTTIENLAGAGYSPNNIAIYMSIPIKKFMQEFNMIESALNFHYRRGILITDAQVGIKLTENAMAGNITAHQQLTKIREQQRLTDLKNRYLYGEEID